MDAYEATKVVFSRIQALDPDQAAKVMGLLLIQDQGEKEMVRLAFGPEVLLQSVMAKARRELGLLPPSGPGSPPTAGRQSPFQLPRQKSGRGGAPSPLSVSSPSSWAQAPVFSRSYGAAEGMGEELVSPVNGGAGAAPFFPRAMDDIQQQQQEEEFAFQNDGGMNPFRTFDGGECRSPVPGDMFPSWANGVAPGHRRSASANEVCLGGDNFGWKPCLYYARGFCKNGGGCRFVHAGGGRGLPDDDAALGAAKMDAAAAEQQQQQECQDFCSVPGASASATPPSPAPPPAPSPARLPPLASASASCCSNSTTTTKERRPR